MDFDPVLFSKVLDYLYVVKMSKNDSLGCIPLPGISSTWKAVFHIYLDFFTLLQPKNNLEKDADKSEGGTVISPTIPDQTNLIMNMKIELDEIERKLEVEESFVAVFMKENARVYNAHDDNTCVHCTASFKSEYICDDVYSACCCD